MPDRSYTWRKLSEAERATFRDAGRDAALISVNDLRGPELVISPWHHPEYRIGALRVLLESAECEAALLEGRAPMYEDDDHGVQYCECDTPAMDVEHDAGCRCCGRPVNFAPSDCDHKWRDYSYYGGDFEETPVVCRDCGQPAPPEIAKAVLEAR